MASGGAHPLRRPFRLNDMTEIPNIESSGNTGDQEPVLDGVRRLGAKVNRLQAVSGEVKGEITWLGGLVVGFPRGTYPNSNYERVYNEWGEVIWENPTNSE